MGEELSPASDGAQWQQPLAELKWTKLRHPRRGSLTSA
jgi:hypothetical protein